jgi:IS1 family transposase
MAENRYISNDPIAIGILNASPEISVRDGLMTEIVTPRSNHAKQGSESVINRNKVLYLLTRFNNDRLRQVLHVVIQSKGNLVLKLREVKGLSQNGCSGSTLIHDGIAYRPSMRIWYSYRRYLSSSIQNDPANYEAGPMRQDDGISSGISAFFCNRILHFHLRDLLMHRPHLPEHYLPLLAHLGDLAIYRSKSAQGYDYAKSSREEQGPFSGSRGCIPVWRLLLGGLLFWGGGAIVYKSNGRAGLVVGCSAMFASIPVWLLNRTNCNQIKSNENQFHGHTIVLQKYPDKLHYCSTVIDMANVLNTDKQIAVIGALAEGSSIRSIERITGVHRDTIMRLGVKVGQGCAKMLDAAMRDLPCNRLEMDEIWGFVGKKDRNVREGEDGVGSVWTFCAIDAETKLVPAFKCGNRDAATAKAFVQDVANRMAYRVQISTDGLHAYVAAMESAYGEFVDYGQIIKTYGHEETSDNRRYSAPKFVSSEKKVIVGNPDERLISTSYVERLNATTRLHMRRLTRLTLAFSKKRENFEAAVALHFAYYNFVKRHNTLRCTPAMAAGVTGTFWGVGDLLEAVA